MTQNGLKITTITPVYNNALFLEECIQSLLQQTYSHMEIILVDDGSSDRSPEILRQYEKHDVVKILYKEHNEGISSAYRTALPHVTGDVICFLDADDVAMPIRIERTAEKFAEDERVGIVYSRMELINSGGESFGLYLNLPDYLNTNNFFMQHFRRGFFTGSGMSFRNASWLKLDRDIICNDYALTLQFADRDYRFAYIDESLTKYRIHPLNTSSQSQRLIGELCDIQGDFSREYLQRKWEQQGHTTAEIYTTFGINSYYFRQDYVEAERFFRLSEEMGGNMETYFYLGNLSFRNQMLQEAYDYFEKAWQLSPELFHVSHNYGILCILAKGDLESGQYLLRQAKESQPYYLLIGKNIEMLLRGELSELRLIHFLSDEDAVHNTYCRMIAK